MATIKEQARLIIEHPFFKDCLDRANKGDFSGFERLFMEIQSHTWERCALDASRVYGQYRRANSCDIKKEIRELPPPILLDLRLPFVTATKISFEEPTTQEITVTITQLKMF
jgi:hypothetical protein